MKFKAWSGIILVRDFGYIKMMFNSLVGIRKTEHQHWIISTTTGWRNHYRDKK